MFAFGKNRSIDNKHKTNISVFARPNSDPKTLLTNPKNKNPAILCNIYLDNFNKIKEANSKINNETIGIWENLIDK